MIDHTPTLDERFDLIFRHLGLAMAQEWYFRQREQTQQARETGILTQPDLNQLYSLASLIEKNPDDYSGSYTPREFRKYLFNYISGLPNNKAVKRKIARANQYTQLHHLLKTYYQQLLENTDRD